MSSALPAGYQMLSDPASGRQYYVNMLTGQSSWSPPAGVAEAAPKHAVSVQGGSLPPGWEERVDPTTGRTFYIDHVNKRTSWEMPRQAAAAARPAMEPFPSASAQANVRQSTFDRDEELARELAAQWEAEDETQNPMPTETSADDATSGMSQKDWAQDADTTHCFLTNTKFTMVNRKHHCRYCGQIFVSEVCKKQTKIPSLGFTDPVRVCDICFDQLERGDPVCICKQVALMRSDSESTRQQGSKALSSWAAMDPQFSIGSIVSALEALKVPELLSQLMQSAAPATQAAAAQLLSAIHSHDTHREPLQQVDLLEPLLATLRGTNAEAKASAMSTLASLTAGEEVRSQFRAANGLAPLLDTLLSSASEPLQTSTCQVLVNLCGDSGDDWRQLLQNGAVFPLVAMLSSTNVELQGYSLTLLAMLCEHNEACEQVSDSGCLPVLARLLGSNKSDVQRASLALVQQLCSTRRACDALLEAGAAAPVASMLLNVSTANTEVLGSLLDTLSLLASSGIGHAQRAVRNVGAVPYLIQLMNHENPRVSQTAASLVSSLCPGDMHNAEQLFESGGIVMLAERLNTGDERSQLQALSALSQLSADAQQGQAIVESGSLQPVLALLEHPNQELKAYAAIAFGNLCNNGSIPPDQLQHPSVLPHLVGMLSSSNGLAKGPAAASLAAMAGSPHLRAAIFDLGGLPGLVSLLHSEADTSYHAVQAIAQFSADERYRAVLAETGAMAPLTSLLQSHLPHVQQCALSAIANNSFVPAAVGPLCAAGAPAMVGQLLFNVDAGSQTMCLTALCNLLANNPASSDALLQVGGHMALLTQLSSSSADAQSQAAMAMGHLCLHPPAAKALLQVDTVPILAQLLHSPNPAVQLQTVYALGVLASADDESASAVMLSGAVAPLSTLLLSSSSVEVKQHLTLTLAHIVRGNWRPVFNVGGFQALLDVLSVATEAIQQDVSASLAALLEDVHQRRALLADLNSVSAIVGLLSSANETTQHNSAAALASLAEESSAREDLYRLGTLSHIIRTLTATNLRDGVTTGSARVSMLRVVAAFAEDSRYCNMLRITIQPLVAMLGSDSTPILVHAAKAVMALSRSESNRDALRDAGAMRRMAELLLHSDEQVQHLAVQCVANLGVDTTDAKVFMASGWHLSLISLLSAGSSDVQGAAAAVLGNLAAVSQFREALMADGALQPILQLLHATELPTRTAAVRALAIMSQQLMSTALPRDDPNSAAFIDAFFDAAALPHLIEVLRTEPPMDTASATTAHRQLVSVLLLVQNLSGGYGQVRSRLVRGGMVAPLLDFLSSRASNATAEADILDSAGCTLANLMLCATGSAELVRCDGWAALVALLRSSRFEVSARAARAIGHLLRDSPAARLAEQSVPLLVALLGKTNMALSSDVVYALGNAYSSHRHLFTPALLAQLATGLAHALVDAAATPARGLALSLLGQLVLHSSARTALRASSVEKAVRALPSEYSAALLLDLLSVDDGADLAAEPSAAPQPVAAAAAAMSPAFEAPHVMPSPTAPQHASLPAQPPLQQAPLSTPPPPPPQYVPQMATPQPQHQLPPQQPQPRPQQVFQPPAAPPLPQQQIQMAQAAPATPPQPQPQQVFQPPAAPPQPQQQIQMAQAAPAAPAAPPQPQPQPQQVFQPPAAPPLPQQQIQMAQAAPAPPPQYLPHSVALPAQTAPSQQQQAHLPTQPMLPSYDVSVVQAAAAVAQQQPALSCSGNGSSSGAAPQLAADAVATNGHGGADVDYMTAPALKPQLVEVPPLIDLSGATPSSWPNLL